MNYNREKQSLEGDLDAAHLLPFRIKPGLGLGSVANLQPEQVISEGSLRSKGKKIIW